MREIVIMLLFQNFEKLFRSINYKAIKIHLSFHF